MALLTDINSNEEFFITAFTQVNAVAKLTDTKEKFVIKKEYTKDFFYFVKHNNTNIFSEIENDLQSLCDLEVDGIKKALLSAFVDIDLSIQFAEDALCLSGGFGKEEMTPIFFDLMNYLKDAKIKGSNIIAFEGFDGRKRRTGFANSAKKFIKEDIACLFKYHLISLNSSVDDLKEHKRSEA